ncbi:MAG: hypothetical protein V7K14_24270 [Nostoc sp.]|uniref:hypothetical protein n=1 Tax=Nostoc sp. TaxID=1180 RepID=UPI002FF90AF8
MILLVLWDGHLARPLYFEAGKMPTPQESSLDSATPIIGVQIPDFVKVVRDLTFDE